MNETTVIIVSWNCRDYLRACLRSLEETDIRSVGEIVVVDNASTDGSAEMVRKEFPSATIYQSESNIGFAAANNLAIRNARSQYVLLLNPDTEVLRPGLLPLVGFMDRHPGAWAAGPTLLNTDGSLQRTGVRFPGVWNVFAESFFLDRLFPNTRVFGRHRELYNTGREPRRVDFAQGSCLIARRGSIVQSVGLIDEGYFMYFEETDWCYRMHKAGGEVWICPEVQVVHHGGGEIGHYDEQRILHFHRSLFRYLKKNSHRMTLVCVRGIIVVRSVVRILAWSVIALVRPTLRQKAVSAVRGYGRVLPLCFRPVPGVKGE